MRSAAPLRRRWTSGGVWGIDRGYLMMIGATRRWSIRRDRSCGAGAGHRRYPRTEAREGRDKRIEQGYIPRGPLAQGNSSKMVHNGMSTPDAGLRDGLRHVKNANTEAMLRKHRCDLDIATSPRCGGRQRDPSWLLVLRLPRSPKIRRWTLFPPRIRGRSGDGRLASTPQATRRCWPRC